MVTAIWQRAERCNRPPARADTEQPADRGEDTGLDHELAEEIAGSRAEGLAQADLAGALSDRYQHDVHDPDPADQQRYRRHAGEQDGQGLGHACAVLRTCVCEVIEKSAVEALVMWCVCKRIWSASR